MTMKFETLPTLPCNGCLNDPDRRADGPDGAMVAVYCEHTLAGGVYRPAESVWTVWSPISFDAFTTHVAKLGILHMQLVAHQDGLLPPRAN